MLEIILVGIGACCLLLSTQTTTNIVVNWLVSIIRKIFASCQALMWTLPSPRNFIIWGGIWLCWWHCHMSSSTKMCKISLLWCKIWRFSTSSSHEKKSTTQLGLVVSCCLLLWTQTTTNIALNWLVSIIRKIFRKTPKPWVGKHRNTTFCVLHIRKKCYITKMGFKNLVA